MKSCHAGCGGSRNVVGSIHGSCNIRIVCSLSANKFKVTTLPLKQLSCAMSNCGPSVDGEISSVSMDLRATLSGIRSGVSEVE